MNETLEEFYNHILGVESPWAVENINRNSSSKEVTAFVVYKAPGEYKCPECGQTGKLHDHRIRRWRHLDSCNHKTLIEASVPRVECKEHGIKQIPVVWAEKNSRFTLEFESAVLLWLKEDPIATVAANFSISWDEVDGIMHRAVKRGMARRKQTKPQHIGIDETSFQKRHEYVTIILDKDTDSVIDVLEDRKAQTLREWLETQQKSDFSGLASISMDMWDPFINAVSSHFKNAAQIIAFDRFHVAQHFAKGLNKVRAAEHQFLGKNSPLSRSKYQWLKNSGRLDNRNKERRDFLALSRMNLKTSRAWRIKEVASTLWTYSYLGAAERNWKALLSWISHCQLQPMITVGRMIRRYFWGILNAIRMQVNNCMLEAKNNRIQRIKKTACGYRNRERFKMAILFHLGGLDLMPVCHPKV